MGTEDRIDALTEQVAVVAGATRGAGRGIARALGEAGATVYCTGRSTTGSRSPYDRPETIDETAAMIQEGGGSAVAVRVDHTVESEVEALFERVHEEQGRLDVVVDSVAGEDPLLKQWGDFWDADLTQAQAGLSQGLVSHFITAKHAARHMIRQKRGLIVEVTDGETLAGGGSPVSQIVKLGMKTTALNMAVELKRHGVAAVAVTPGFLRSESMLEHFKVTEDTWRDGGKEDSNFLESESPLFVGRAVAALAADDEILHRSGHLLSSWELGRDYGFTDYDGRRPDWGARTLDFSMFPPDFLQVVRDSIDFQEAWLERVLERTRRYRAQLPDE